MKTFIPLSVIAGWLLVGCGNNSSGSNSAAGKTNAAGENNPATAPVDYLNAVGNAQKTAIKTVDTTSIHEAIQMFQVENGRFPKDLNELVQKKYLPRLPQPPHGMKFDYDPHTGQIKVVPQPQ